MISFCMIARNSARTLPETLDCILPLADEICAVDGGSTDRTVEIFKSYGAQVEIAGPEEEPEWYMEINNDRGEKVTTLARFDLARNRSFDMAKGDSIAWIDTDDLIEATEKWPEAVSEFRKNNLDALVLPYDYEFDSKGRCTCVHWRERLLKNKPSLRWVYPVHEIIRTEDCRVGIYRDMHISHRRHLRSDVNKRRNLEVLKVKGDPDSPRTKFYLGVEYSVNKEYREAARCFAEYLEVAWDYDESYQALVMLGEIQRVFGKWEEAINCYQKATVVRPDWRDAYMGLSLVFVQQEEWARAAFFGEEARKRSSVMDTPLPWNPQLEKTGWIRPLATAYEKMGRLTEALDIVREGLREDETNAPLRSLNDSLSKAINDSAYSSASTAVIEGLLRRDEGIKAIQVCEVIKDTSVPSNLARQAFVQASTGGLPGRQIQNIDLEPWIPDGRLGWFADWVLDHPDIEYMAFPGCGTALLGRLAHDLFGKKVFAWDPETNIQSYFNPYTRWCINRKGMALIPQCAPLSWKPPEKVDAVILSEVLEYSFDPEGIIKQALSMVRPGGHLLAIVPHNGLDPNGPPPSWTNLRLQRFDSRRLRQMLGTWLAPTVVRSPQGSEYLIGSVLLPRKSIAPRSIAIYCPQVPERWDWKTLEIGVGGSEEAVIRLSRILAKRGHSVTVYGDSDSVDVGDGYQVAYREREDYKKSDLCVIWRFPEIALLPHPPEAEWTWLWMEDIMDGNLLLQAAQRVDRIIAMSEWHVGLYPHVRAKMTASGNGIDPAEFPLKGVPRFPHRFIWTSCPTRGLDRLLEAWPAIRASLPNATLDVYYGLEMIKSILPQKPKEEQEKLQEKIDKVEKLKVQDGVKWKGRVGHAEVAKAMLGAGVWCYPNDWFFELFSATAAKAQAAGCWPVIFETGALGETVAWGWRATEESLVADCIAAATCLEDRTPMMRWAQKAFDWERVADLWEEMMERP